MTFLPGRLNAAVARAYRLAAFAACAVLAAGCGGGAGSVPTAPGRAQSASTAQVTFTMHWASSSTSAALRTPKYVGAAQSISVTVNGGSPQFLNAPLTTLVIDAPVGTDTFVFTTYDQLNGGGNVISTASVTKQIVLGAANTVSAVLNGVVASFTVTLQNASPNAGVPASEQISINAFDADGNVIAGSASNYEQPFTLSVSDPSNSGQVTLSTTVVKSRSVVSTMHYAGGTLWSASIVVSAPGLGSHSVTFAPKPTFYQFSIPVSTNRPQFIAAGSDGNMWFTESPNDVARITPAGVVTEFTVPTASSNPQQIIGASDGNLWFTEFGANKIAKVTTTGTFTEFATLFA